MLAAEGDDDDAEGVAPGRPPLLPQPGLGRHRMDRGPRGASRTSSSSSSRREVVVLSRVAEELYWIGRYVERAEDTSRLLDVHVHSLLEDPWVDPQQASRDVLRVMGAAGARRPARRPRAPPTGWPSRAATRARSPARWRAPRDAARGVREALSSELWECLNATYHALPAQEVAAPLARPARLLPLRPRARGGGRRPARRDDAARRRLALPRARPLAGARRHDRPAAAVAGRPVERQQRLGRPAQVLQRARGLPAHLPRRGRAGAGRRVPRARPAVPAVGLRGARAGRDLPGRARPQRRPHRRRRRRPPAARPGPHRPRVPDQRRAARRAAGGARHAAAHGVRGRRRARHALLRARHWRSPWTAEADA